jgi:coenzyme F420-0:L-glutamate ligase/coenzyme F420-1:gamma-L-glutamate ligase
MIEIVALTGIPEVLPGDDLAAILADAVAAAGVVPLARDVLVVTQKIVSKAEGRFVSLAAVRPGAEAERIADATGKDARLVELVLDESAAVVRTAPNLLITRHRTGHVMANAGIDRSNLGAGEGDRALLLPEDSDASAERLRAGLARRWPAPPAIVISDSFGRPWRMGVVNVAIGASGLPALIDRRGERDRDGRLLEVTQVAFADMVASAAGLATGEGAEGVPAALVRGLDWSAPDAPASALVRPVEEDLFR